jgi:GT2 family glycosyltransferase
MNTIANKKIGVVIIGRNEGQRLIDCINSIPANINQVVYVDSDSSDNSVAEAKSRNCIVHSLDLSIPFTAGRARNEGFEALIKKYPHIEFVQFVDGDCNIDSNWLDNAQEHLQNHENIAIVCGRRKEKHPKATIYNQLCDIEWDTPVGIAKSSGGDFMIKRVAFEKVSGFTPTVIAGEEPELCFRLRKHGYQIERLDLPMTYHDANMTSFSQWWKRAIRGGHAYAEGYSRHGHSEEKFNKRQTLSALIWFSILPLSLPLALINKYALFLLLLYPLQIMRLSFRNKSIPSGFWYSFFLVVGKVPESIGIMKYYFRKLLKRDFQIIEYK